MKPFDFKNRLFLAYAAVTIGMVLLFAALLIIITSSLNRQTEQMHQQEVFGSNLAQIETLLSQAGRLATQVSTSNELLSVFIALDDPDALEGGDGNYFDDQLMDAIRISSLLSGINGVDGFADRISVYNRYGDYVSTGRLYETPESIAGTLGDTGEMDALTGEIMARDSHFLVAGFHPDQWSSNPNAQFISLYRTLSYTETSAPYGLVAVQLQASRLSGLEFWQSGTGHEYFLMDDRRLDDARLVYPQAEDFPLEAVYAPLMDAMADGTVASIPLSLAGGNALLLAARVEGSNWILLRLLPRSSLTTPYRSAYAIMLLGCLGLMALFLFVVRYMAGRISRPLKELSASIGAISLQNMHLGTEEKRPSYSTQELISLDEAFRTMLSRLDKSIALEMQAYMRVLQSQMNPHFLYNMLSVIIASSESAGDARTVSMCLKLTAMLRYIADFQRESVTLRDELTHTRNYLALMKDRYEDLFTYEIDADDRALEAILPKLTVQPLAENCFMHGFETEPPWHIHIMARAERERWWLRVEDNGMGMTEEEISSLLDRMETYKQDVAGKYQELSLGGMGLVNTLLRLALFAEGPVRHAIENRPEGGLRIEIGGVIHDPGYGC